MQRKAISFKGQKIFVGIDVHKRKWAVTALTESGYMKTHCQNSSAQELCEYLHHHFPGGVYLAAYESGFSSFSTYYELKELGIDCIVIHAADVPSTQYEDVMKTDKIDSVRLAKALRLGLLKCIYIRHKDDIDDRAVIRMRLAIIKDLNRSKSRVKHLLMNNGIKIPEQFERRKGSSWTKAFMQWLRSDLHLLSKTRTALDLLLSHVEKMKQSQLEANRKLRLLSQTSRYRDNYELIRTIPGIGQIVAMTLLTEISDFNRFKNERQFASYLGLVPMSHSSGDKIIHGEMTFRGNKQLGPLLIEASWIAIRHDIGLAAAYASYCKKMKPQQAIVRIARKLSNIIRAVLKSKQKYVPYSFG